jgi:hypothetical protein
MLCGAGPDVTLALARTNAVVPLALEPVPGVDVSAGEAGEIPLDAVVIEIDPVLRQPTAVTSCCAVERLCSVAVVPGDGRGGCAGDGGVVCAPTPTRPTRANALQDVPKNDDRVIRHSFRLNLTLPVLSSARKRPHSRSCCLVLLMKWPNVSRHFRHRISCCKKLTA